MPLPGMPHHEERDVMKTDAGCSEYGMASDPKGKDIDSRASWHGSILLRPEEWNH